MVMFSLHENCSESEYDVRPMKNWTGIASSRVGNATNRCGNVSTDGSNISSFVVGLFFSVQFTNRLYQREYMKYQITFLRIFFVCSTTKVIYTVLLKRNQSFVPFLQCRIQRVHVHMMQLAIFGQLAQVCNRAYNFFHLRNQQNLENHPTFIESEPTNELQNFPHCKNVRPRETFSNSQLPAIYHLLLTSQEQQTQNIDHK